MLGFDTCLMNMVEIGYQLRNQVSFMIGSQEVEPGDGWPYEKVAAVAAQETPPAPAELATAVVSAYVA